MEIHLRVLGFFKKTILCHVERMLGNKIDVHNVEIYVNVRFKEVNHDVEDFPH